jgi:hypothetical protein
MPTLRVHHEYQAVEVEERVKRWIARTWHGKRLSYFDN